MGSSTNVPLEKRVSIWVETLPKLLAHLDIKHVTVLSHCAGTVYALNTLYQCRDILHPKRPQVVLLGMLLTHYLKKGAWLSGLQLLG